MPSERTFLWVCEKTFSFSVLPNYFTSKYFIKTVNFANSCDSLNHWRILCHPMRSATGSKTLMAAIRTHHPQIGHGWLSLFFIVYLLNPSYSPKYISDNRDRGSCRFTFFSEPLCNISVNFLRTTSSIYCWGETTFELSEEALSKDKIIITVVWLTLKILILFYAKSCSRCVTVLITLIRWKTHFLYGYICVNINNTRKILN